MARGSAPGPARGGAVVTGAGRGLGREIARRLAARGLVVHATDRDGAAAARTAAELGGGAWSSTLDVTDAAACEQVARATAARAGTLAVWINNAGVMPVGRAWEHDAQERRTAVAVNLLGTMNGTVAALALMRPRGAGHVVNVVSLAGLVAPPGEVLYAATKHAALAFSVGTALDLRLSGARGVHVSAICPDAMLTPMLAEVAHAPAAALSWSGALLAPERVAERVAALLERPRPLVSVPRWRGGTLRAYAALPRLAARVQPAAVALARARQRARARRAPAAAETPAAGRG
jgi:short-subunit dehydrogenase